MGNAIYLIGYAAVMAVVWWLYARRRSLRHRSSVASLESSRSAGLMEPPSLHPLIDPHRCLGCAACVDACPENNVLGLISGKAVLASPANCIGHGACREACPFDAITLVLGTATRGVDVPVLSPDFQTSVPGIFVAGELGGMGLIRNAIEQGRQAMEAIRSLEGMGEGPELDLAIIGAGPAGFSASLAARMHGLRSITIEQEELGGTVAHYPRGKIVMTQPADLPLVGRVRMRETTKEALLEFWQRIERETGVEIRYGERVDKIERTDEGFLVATSRGEHRVRAVLLAIGRRGSPRKLGVPGENSSKVVYRLIDPEQYAGKRVLVVGGGDSALEAAASIADQPGTEVVLSYRGEAFARAKPKNRERVDSRAAAGALRVILSSEVAAIADGDVTIRSEGGNETIDNDAVIVCVGGVLPTGFLESVGIAVETRYGTA